MILPSDIHARMEVVGSDGGHVGRVEKVRGEEIELTRLDLEAGLRHHLIPVSWVEQIDQNTVRLNMTKAAAKAAWRTKH